MPGNLEEIVTKARRGDPAALNGLLTAVQPKIYGLALRMLWHPEDAKDATQEILLRIVTHLGTFRGNSSFATWAYRVAANHLLSWRKSRMEAQGFAFETFGKDLEEGLDAKSRHPADTLLLQEIRVGCTLGMLLCLDRPHRIVYILGEILEIDSREGASILGIKRVDRSRLLFASDPVAAGEFPNVLVRIRKLQQAQRAVALYRSHPEHRLPDLAATVRQLLAGA